MESTTLSPNGATGAAATHSLADPAAERTLDTILATPFAEVDPPAELPTELPPAADIEPEPPTPETAEPDADPDADPGADEPPSLPESMAVFLPEGVTAAEPEAPAAQSEPETPAAEPVAEPAQEPASSTPQDKLKAIMTLEYQPTNFAVFHGKPVEITATHNEDAFFDGHYVTIDKMTGRIVIGTKIEQQPTAHLEPLRNATSLLRLRKGLILRAFDVLDGLLAAVGREIEQVDACIETLAAAKTAIRGMLPEKSKDLVF